MYDRITSQVDAPAIYDGKLPAYYLLDFFFSFDVCPVILLCSAAKICIVVFL